MPETGRISCSQPNLSTLPKYGEIKVDSRFTPEIIRRVIEERVKQNTKYPEDRNLPLPLWSTVLAEEVGESARAVLEHDLVNLEEELVQVAAVAVAWLEDLQYQKEKGNGIRFR